MGINGRVPGHIEKEMAGRRRGAGLSRMYDSHTDLALEANNGNWQAVAGVESRQVQADGVTVTRIKVTTDEAARQIGKAVGTYVTFEIPELRRRDGHLQERVSRMLAAELLAFIEASGQKPVNKVLIIGLGNDHVTPDALGPSVVEQVVVTRHYFELMPQDVRPGVREVSAIAPGVLGTTGIETSEIVHGIVANVKPDLIIAVDSLASRALARLHTTVQMADTGIQPGSGVGNKRKALNRETLGVPVIALGVPTVVYASTIVHNCLEYLHGHLRSTRQAATSVLGMLDDMSYDERLRLVKQVLEPLGQDLLVTPKDIDQFIDDTSSVISEAINLALHEPTTLNPPIQH
jgi:spore protease